MEESRPLAAELAQFKEAFNQRAAPARVATMESATARLRQSGIEQQARRSGDRAPDASLQDALGEPVRLSDYWRDGPAVVVFYRGGWCPYCNLELRAWQRRLDQLKQTGATLVAVSPQTPDNSLSTVEKNELAYQVLSDSGLEAATGFGIAFTLEPDLAELYRSVGHDLPVINGNGRWALPVPASFVIDSSGMIRYAHVEVDYRERAEPDDILRVLAAMQSDAGPAPR